MNAQRSIKPKHHQAVRTTVSMTPALHDAAMDLVRKHGFAGLSDYLAARIRHDAGLDSFMVRHDVALR